MAKFLLACQPVTQYSERYSENGILGVVLELRRRECSVVLSRLSLPQAPQAARHSGASGTASSRQHAVTKQWVCCKNRPVVHDFRHGQFSSKIVPCRPGVVGTRVNRSVIKGDP